MGIIMAESEVKIIEKATPSKKKRRWLRRLFYLLVCLVVLVLAVYVTVTSSWGIRTLILPRVSTIADINIQAGEVDVSLFKARLQVRNLIIGKPGNPMFSGKKVACKFDLGAILNGHIKLSEIRISGVKGSLQIKEKVERHGDISTSTPSKPKKSSGKSTDGGVTLDLRDVKITDVDFELKLEGAGGGKVISLKQVNLSSEHFTNGQDAKVALTASVDFSSGQAMKLQGDLKVDAVVNLDQDWNLKKVILHQTAVSGLSGNVGKTKISKRSLNIIANVETGENSLKISRFMFSEVNGKSLSSIDLTAEIGFKPLKINANIKKGHLSSDLVSSISMLAAGISPGHNEIDFGGKISTQNGNIAAVLQLKVTRSGDIVYGEHTYPVMPAVINANTQLTCDLKNERLAVEKFNINAVSRGKKRLDLRLLKSYTWQRKSNKPLNLSFYLEADELDLKLVEIFVNSIDIKGSFSAKLYIGLSKLFKDIAVRGDWTVKDFALQLPGWKMPVVTVANKLNGSIADLEKLSFTENTLTLYDGAKYQGKAALTGKYSLKSGTGDLKFTSSKLNLSFLRKLIFTPDNIANDYIAPLEPLTIDAETRANIDLTNEHMSYRNTHLTLKRDGSDYVAASVPAFRLNTQDPLKYIKGVTCKLKVNRADLVYFNRLIPASQGRFKQGRISLDGTGKFGESITDIQFDIKSSAENVYYKASIGVFNDLSYKLKTNGRWTLKSGLQNTSVELSLGRSRRQIVMLKGDGSCVFPAGPLSLALSCDGVSQEALNLFKPDALKYLDTDFKLNCEASAGFKKYSYSGHVVMKKLQKTVQTTPVSGKLDFGGDGNLDFIDGTADMFISSLTEKRRLTNLNMKYKWPLRGSKKIGFVNIVSSLIDLPGLRNVFVVERKAAQASGKKSGRKKRKPQKPVEVKFNFGERAIKAELDLKKILLGGSNKGSLTGKFYLQKNTFKADPLRFVVNRAPLNAKVSLVSSPAGVIYKVKADSYGFDLTPFFKLITTATAQSATGYLRSLNVDVSGVGLRAPRLWDNMAGNLNIDLRDVSIPYSFSNTWVGNVFFIPMNMMSQITRYVPSLSTSWRTVKSVNTFKDIMSSKYNIELDKGIIRLVSEKGVIKVNQCYFSGRKMGNLSFSGKMRLGTAQHLDLKSLYSYYGIKLPVSIYGTLSEPKTNSVANISAEFLRRNAISLLTGDDVSDLIIKSGKDIKAIFRGIRKGGKKKKDSSKGLKPPAPDEDLTPEEERRKLRKELKDSVKDLIKLF
jgi:hypothetical protein